MKAMTVTLSLIIFTLASSSFLYALTYDFEKAEQGKDWTVLSGTWEVKDGAYRETKDAGGPLVSVVGEDKWADYTITVKGQGLIGDADWGIAFRVKDASNHYSWQYVNSNLMFVSYINGGRTENFQQPQGEILNEWQEFKVVAKGNTFDLYWKEKKITTFKHDTLKSGKIGVFGWVNSGLVLGKGGGVAFDDFNAEGPGIPSSAAVQPAQKLPITWGGIKSRY
jgi:hypothetical protein